MKSGREVPQLINARCTDERQDRHGPASSFYPSPGDSHKSVDLFFIHEYGPKK